MVNVFSRLLVVFERRFQFIEQRELPGVYFLRRGVDRKPAGPMDLGKS